MTRADLIAALEKAEGPSRELDAEIRKHVPGDYLPAFTASLDAALTLVPEGRYRVYLERLPVDSGPAWKALVRHHGRGHEIEESGHTEHPALCLCIAALKARE